VSAAGGTFPCAITPDPMLSASKALLSAAAENFLNVFIVYFYSFLTRKIVVRVFKFDQTIESMK